jgi:hypothetical protein
VRHARQVRDDRLAADRFAERQRQGGVRRPERLRLEDVAQVDRLAAHVGQLDADDVAARDDGGPRRGDAHGARDGVGERHDARGFRAARRLELEERDDRPRLDLANLALDREVGEHLLEQARGSAQHRLRELRS